MASLNLDFFVSQVAIFFKKKHVLSVSQMKLLIRHEEALEVNVLLRKVSGEPLLCLLHKSSLATSFGPLSWKVLSRVTVAMALVTGLSAFCTSLSLLTWHERISLVLVLPFSCHL